MSLIPAAVEQLAAELARLPGIGPKTAQRLTFHCLRMPGESLEALARALSDIPRTVRRCTRCFFISDGPLCAVCAGDRRDASQLCIVEEALDVIAVERSGGFGGLYHVLEGALSPIDGVGPAQLRIEELEGRLSHEGITEVILATDPDVEGEATASYLAERLSRPGIRVSRLAHGLPAGADLQYADEVTVARALAGRQPL